MAAYLIADIDVHDPQGIKEYQAKVPDTLKAYGGRYLVRGGANETLEGSWPAHRIILLEFPDMKSAKAWYASAAYQEILPIRLRYSSAKFLTLVEGV
jgi:uncharacterized protein (DUF1330 family)